MSHEENWHSLPVSKIFEQLASAKNGLNSHQVREKRQSFGFNKLPTAKPIARLVLLFNQIKSPLVYVLLMAVVISIFLRHYADAGVIFFVVVINTIFGYWQESQANNSLQKLKEIVKQQAKVWRDGQVARLDSAELVPGDVIILRAGDKVPADARLLESADLQTVEALLTGESTPIRKQIEVLPVGTALAERKNMVYLGTLIARGEGLAVVCATGIRTEIGKIGILLKETKETATPLQLRLVEFSRWLTLIIVSISFLIFIQGYLAGRHWLDMFLTVVAVAVSAIPEGLLVAVTIILTLGMQFILKRQALVRKLLATETLGCTSVICTDKTGTLTEGVMRVAHIVTADEQYHLATEAEAIKMSKARNLIHEISLLCSSAVIENPGSELVDMKVIGDPTETALLLAAVQSGFDKTALTKEYEKLQEIPFDSAKKYMATLHSHKGDDYQYIFVKGAPEPIFAFANQVLIGGKKVELTKQQLDSLKHKHASLTAKGLRLLAFAYKTGKLADHNLPNELNGLVWLGFVAIKDPLRSDAKATIKLCQQAGIRPVVITGDHRLTAKAIFEELDFKPMDGNIVEGADLDKWSDEELKQKVKDIDIYARVEPRHKLRIVDAWQARGEVVAMTGDGINDAPAIKTADIGIALGSGSDVTKETADMVLLDNNFSVIVAAVEQGRIIFANIRKVILYLMSDSFSEIILITGSLILGLPLPVLATQILWINLVADGLPNIAMTLEPGEPEIMEDKPRKKDEPIVNRPMKIIFAVGIATDFILLGLFVVLLKMFTDLDYIRTIIFVALGIDSLLYVFSIRSWRYSILAMNPLANRYLLGAVVISFLVFFLVVYAPWLQPIFHTVSLGLVEWVLILVWTLFKVSLIELAKYFFIIKKI